MQLDSVITALSRNILELQEITEALIYVLGRKNIWNLKHSQNLSCECDAGFLFILFFFLIYTFLKIWNHVLYSLQCILPFPFSYGHVQIFFWKKQQRLICKKKNKSISVALSGIVAENQPQKHWQRAGQHFSRTLYDTSGFPELVAPDL